MPQNFADFGQRCAAAQHLGRQCMAKLMGAAGRRLDAGPLEGVEGVLTQVKDAWRVVVNVELLQRSVAAEVDRDVISVVSRCAPRPVGSATQQDWKRSPHARL